MKLLQWLCIALFLCGMALAQTPATTPDTSNITNQIQQLQQAMADQQKAMEAQQQKIAEQQKQLEQLQQQLGAQVQAVSANGGGTPHLVNAVLTPAGSSPQGDKPKESPLSFRIGGAEFTPGGFIDFENIFRSTNTGNTTNTGYGSIPFNDAVAGHLTEYRSTGQYSRFSLKMADKFGKNDVVAYLEFDFNGNDAANVYDASNPHTDRMRAFWVNVRRGKWEFLGGQAWGLQTPQRVGIDPASSNMSIMYGEDSAIGVGMNYTRAGLFRVAYHFNKEAVWAVEIQNPQQYVGTEVTYPSLFNTILGSQIDTGSVTGAPNAGPDILSKFAYDHDFGKNHFHIEFGGIERTFKVSVAPTVTGVSPTTGPFTNHSKMGGGFFADTVADLWKGSGGRNFRFVANFMGGPGVGRYLNNLAPDVVIHPVVASGYSTCAFGATGGCDAAIDLVSSYDGILGLEFAPAPKTQFGMYYGAMFAGRDYWQDLTVSGVHYIGFGYVGSSANNNRAIQEFTVNWNQTFWKHPQYGALMMVVQSSYLTRSPWSNTTLALLPKNAHLFMTYASLRYVLP